MPDGYSASAFVDTPITITMDAAITVIVVLVAIVAVAKIKFANAAMLANVAQIAIAQPIRSAVTLVSAQPSAMDAKITAAKAAAVINNTCYFSSNYLWPLMAAN